MFSPNDLVAVGPRSFYASNDHGNRSKRGRLLEDYLQLARSYVVYYDGSDMRIAAEGFGYANGINVDREGKKLYLATTIGRSLHVFSRDIPSGKLTKERDISLNTGADNIEIDADGNLYVTCHPKLLAFSAHSKDRTKLSPSQVLKISFSGADQYTIKEIYLNDGTEISGSSVAAPFSGGFMVGQVFEDHILICR
jgi:arylesterase/paraoxonase